MVGKYIVWLYIGRFAVCELWVIKYLISTINLLGIKAWVHIYCAISKRHGGGGGGGSNCCLHVPKKVGGGNLK